MASKYEICFINHINGRSYVRCGIYNMSKEDAEKILADVKPRSRKPCFIRQHPERATKKTKGYCFND